MGYRVTLEYSDVAIIKLFQSNALQAVKGSMSRTDLMGGGGQHKNEQGKIVHERWFAWVDTEEVLAAATLKEALRAWWFDTEEEENGTLLITEYMGEKWGDQQHLLAALAPFIRDNSEMIWSGEDDDRWRYLFRNGTLFVQEEERHWSEELREVTLTPSKATEDCA